MAVSRRKKVVGWYFIQLLTAYPITISDKNAGSCWSQFFRFRKRFL